MQAKSPVFCARWERELAKLELALSHIPENRVADRTAMIQKIDAIKEVIHESK